MSGIAGHIAKGQAHLVAAADQLALGHSDSALALTLACGREASLAARGLVSSCPKRNEELILEAETIDPQKIASAAKLLVNECKPSQLKILSLVYSRYCAGKSAHELGLKAWEIYAEIYGENSGSIGQFLGRMRRAGLVEKNVDPYSQRNCWRPTAELVAICLAGNVSEQSFYGIELPDSRPKFAYIR